MSQQRATHILAIVAAILFKGRSLDDPASQKEVLAAAIHDAKALIRAVQ